jgi:hypothetical protein
MSHIFISYSRADKDCAYKIQRQLEAQGFKVWIDKNDIPAGAPFPMEILQAIRGAAAVLILWSKNSAGSHFVGKEIEVALSQNMSRSMPVIPVWLDGHPLHLQLESLNAISLTDCSDDLIDILFSKLPEPIKQTLGRQFHVIDPDKKLKDQDHTLLPNGLVSIPYVTSRFCSAVLIGTPDAILTDHFNNKKQKPVICVVPQFLGDTTDTTVDQVYNSIRDDLGDQAFLCLHVIPNKVGRILIDIHERGQTLDVVKTTYEATYALVKRNRNLATIKIFTPMMAAMAGSVGYMFDSFWHVQQYHFDRGNDRYYLLFDSKDL